MLSYSGKINRVTTATLLAFLLFSALAIRMAGLSALKETIYIKHLLWDEQMYHQWAISIVAGEPNAAILYDQAPLPAYLLAAVYTLFSPDPLYFRFINIACGILTCYFLYLVGRNLDGKAAGLISCGFAAIYAPYILYSIVPLKTALSICLFALFLVLVTVNLPERNEKISAGRLFSLGLVLGLVAAVRSNMLIIIFFIFPYLCYLYSDRLSWKRYIAGLTVFFLGLLLALSPFSLIKYQATGKLLPASSQFGRNLYYGNGPENDTPYYRPMPFASSVPGESSTQFVIEASRRAGTDLTPKEASSFWTAEVLRHIQNHPLDWSRHMLRKFLAVVNDFEAGDHYNIQFLARFVPLFTLPFPGYGILFSLGMAGIFLTWKSSRLTRHMAILFVLYCTSLIVFYVGARYRLPLTVILIPWAAAGMVHFVLYLRQKTIRPVALYLFIFALSLTATRLPVNGAGDLTAYYNTHAFLLNAEQRGSEAIEYWEESVRLDGAYSDPARLFLAGKYYQQGKKEKAYETIEAIPDTSVTAFSKYSLLGDLYAHEGKNSEAISAYEKSLSYNAGQRRIRRELIKLYYNDDKKRDQAFAQYEELKRIESFFAK